MWCLNGPASCTWREYDDIRSVCNHADEQCHNGDLSMSVSDALLPFDPAAPLPPAKPASSVIVCWHTGERKDSTPLPTEVRLPAYHCSDGTLLAKYWLYWYWCCRCIYYHLQTTLFSSNGHRISIFCSMLANLQLYSDFYKTNNIHCNRMFDIIVILLHIPYDCVCVIFFCIFLAIFGNSASDCCKGANQILLFVVAFLFLHFLWP